MNPQTGDVTLLLELDRETEPQHNLTLQATDQGSPPKLDTALLTVIVLDFNDNAPRWTDDLYETTISEGLPINTFVIQVYCTIFTFKCFGNLMA